MSKASETVLEIDLNALAHNYNYITSKLEKETKVMAVVKAFGYGSDAVMVAKELVALGVSYFAVAYAKEGVLLRDAGITTPILVLHTLPSNFDSIINKCLEPSIYSKKILKQFVAFAEQEQQRNYPIHLKFNTGLNRLGFTEEELPNILEELTGNQHVKIKSAFSHLAASEDKNEIDFTKRQLNSFKRIRESLLSAVSYRPFFHTLNTSGILNFPSHQYDMVRTGIGLYGFGNDLIENKKLKPVATLKTVISQIHTLQKGDTLGYNRAYKVQNTMKTATLPIGHADGISRAFGNGIGWVTINGQKAPIQGNVCMDMIMVDVSNIECEEGDEVIIFGTTTTAEKLSNAINSISYELLTAISQRVKRVVHRK
ncbi:alanine racemase [Patiriisocius sp. Uisw_017]|uniref:alanine racemase n=1 Tax=Patiriisocius sp. Uisw_017 TaxID=3230968 RepID=UPI0039E7911E